MNPCWINDKGLTCVGVKPVEPVEPKKTARKTTKTVKE